MHEFPAARRAACVVLGVLCLARAVGAQAWNDSLSRALVERAVQRRAQQLADTGLVDYRASAHGYVNFLAQLGEGFRTPPKLLKADELELEVYWHAPNQSKQRIIGRRDTLLLPTDIAYHRDHLGIVQNNFPNLIRVGEGDEVRDVPHPASPPGLALYDFAITDSFSIGTAAQRIRVYEIKVRPKDDRQPRVVGALYIDPASAQIVRMNLSFTRAAFLDDALEELSIVLENRLVAGKYWLPSSQQVEIVRNGQYLDYPVRGIIRGRWVIGDYKFNLNLAPTVFMGPEIVQAPPEQLKQYPWPGKILDSLPPDVRAVSEPDIERVKAEARQLVRARALERAQKPRLSVRNASDFVRYDRVEGLALGGGVSKQFGFGISANARGRYGIDDATGKGAVSLALARTNGVTIRAFGSRDFRDVGDVPERSTAVNSLAAQEFGSDYTDPYLVRAAGGSVDFPTVNGFSTRFTASAEWISGLAVHATPVTGTFEPTLPVVEQHTGRYAFEIDRAPVASTDGAEWSGHADLRATVPTTDQVPWTLRAAYWARFERPVHGTQLVFATAGAIVGAPNARFESSIFDATTELVYLGGPVSGPGYAYHSLVAQRAITGSIEWQLPAPFIPFSLGRFGRVPARGRFAPFAHVIGIDHVPIGGCVPATLSVGAPGRLVCGTSVGGFYPSFGAQYITPFDLLHFQIARGTGRGGRWTFSVDLSREFWSIL